MRRYVTRIDGDDSEPVVPDLTVFEKDIKPVDTGLLDETGTKLYRVEDREPIGFVCLRK